MTTTANSSASSGHETSSGDISASSISTQADEQGVKFTPGPWSFGSHCIEAANGSRVVDIDGGPPMRVADARLIAAAPTMVEYVKSCADLGCPSAKKIMEQINGSR